MLKYLETRARLKTKTWMKLESLYISQETTEICGKYATFTESVIVSGYSRIRNHFSIDSIIVIIIL